MATRNFVTVNDAANAALDLAYNKTAGPMLKKIDNLVNAPASKLQRALVALDEEAARLAEKGERMAIDNPVLEKAFRVMEEAYKEAAALIGENDEAIQDSAEIIAQTAVTAKVFSNVSELLMSQGQSPITASAMRKYKKEIKVRGVKWKIPNA